MKRYYNHMYLVPIYFSKSDKHKELEKFLEENEYQYADPNVIPLNIFDCEDLDDIDEVTRINMEAINGRIE